MMSVNSIIFRVAVITDGDYSHYSSFMKSNGLKTTCEGPNTIIFDSLFNCIFQVFVTVSDSGCWFELKQAVQALSSSLTFLVFFTLILVK